MISKPSCGWCRILIGDFETSGSYLEDYPYCVSEAFISALKQVAENPGIGNNRLLSYFIVDAEGQGRYLVWLYPDKIKVTEEADSPTEGELEYESVPNKNCLFELAAELVQDLHSYFEEWVAWMCDDEPEILEQRKKDISNFMLELNKLSS